ncbi:hypothetical protein DUI87_19116 [Hirundo rustica rustica]|uniref:Uncharacterized protein n=1 Tax=Hirundo rustica rustica TaxID=333673 RepID=A0A3M0KAU8_HIRRU|nr:hypothetical protein DUI87_19116 [Hirundo rustica rustica]
MINLKVGKWMNPRVMTQMLMMDTNFGESRRDQDDQKMQLYGTVNDITGQIKQEELAPPPLGGSSHNGMMEYVMSLVGPNGPLSEDVPLEDGGVVKEIRNTASLGINIWAIIRRHLPSSPLELQEKDKTSPKNQLSTDEIV